MYTLVYFKVKKIYEKLALINFLNQVFLVLFDILREIFKREIQREVSRFFTITLFKIELFLQVIFLLFRQTNMTLFISPLNAQTGKLYTKLYSAFAFQYFMLCLYHQMVIIADLASLRPHCVNSAPRIVTKLQEQNPSVLWCQIEVSFYLCNMDLF